MIGLGKFNLTKKTSLILILTYVFAVVFDSTIVRYVTFTGTELPMTISIFIFVTIFVIFCIASSLLISSVRRIVNGNKSQPRTIEYFHLTISLTIIFVTAIVLAIIFQMIILNSYSLILVSILTYVSHISPLAYLLFLIILFGGWIKSKRNTVTLLYTISFVLVSVNLVIALIYLELYFTKADTIQDVKPYPIIAFVANTLPPPPSSLLSTIFDGFSLSSFLLMWTATALLLSQYRYRMGIMRYCILMGIPLIYYIFPFQNYLGDPIYPLLESYPYDVSTTYILIFSASKQVGAVLFSLSFWTASTLVYDDRVRRSLIMSAVGIAILFGSVELAPLQYHVYPPYGIVTEAFIPLGAYLLFIGIYTSARYISQDTELRKALYKNAASQLNLLKAIGISQMEKELEKKVEVFQERFAHIGTNEEAYLNEEMDKEDIKKTLHEVLSEIYPTKTKQNSEY